MVWAMAWVMGGVGWLFFVTERRTVVILIMIGILPGSCFHKSIFTIEIIVISDETTTCWLILLSLKSAICKSLNSVGLDVHITLTMIAWIKANLFGNLTFCWFSGILLFIKWQSMLRDECFAVKTTPLWIVIWVEVSNPDQKLPWSFLSCNFLVWCQPWVSVAIKVPKEMCMFSLLRPPHLEMAIHKFQHFSSCVT